MDEADLTAMRLLRRFRRRVLGNVERVEPVAERHEHAAMLRVLLGNLETEHVAIEPL